MDRRQRIAQHPRGERVKKPKDFIKVTSSMCASAAKQLTATSDLFYIPCHQRHPLTATSDRFFTWGEFSKAVCCDCLSFKFSCRILVTSYIVSSLHVLLATPLIFLSHSCVINAHIATYNTSQIFLSNSSHPISHHSLFDILFLQQSCSDARIYYFKKFDSEGWQELECRLLCSLQGSAWCEHAPP